MKCRRASDDDDGDDDDDDDDHDDHDDDDDDDDDVTLHSIALSTLRQKFFLADFARIEFDLSSFLEFKTLS